MPLSRRLFVGSIAIITAMAVAAILYFWHQHSIYRLTLKARVDKPVTVVLSDVDDSGKAREVARFELLGDKLGQLQHVGTSRLLSPIQRARLTFLPQAEQVATVVQVDEVFIKLVYDDDVLLRAGQIPSFFRAEFGMDGGSSNLFEIPPGKRMALTSRDRVTANNWGMVVSVTLFFLLAVYCIGVNARWSQIPAFADMNLGRHISSTAEFNNINGLRGLAALLVLFSHTAPGWEALQIGIAILFVISGFLLTKPFALDSNKIFSWSNIERYLTKRMKRILPMYYLFVFLTYGLTLKIEHLVRHILFIEAGGHLWPMTQIFVFYMMLPLVLLVTSAVARLHKLAPLIVLSIGIYFSITQMGEWRPFFNGEYYHEFFLYAFLMGVFASYLQYTLIEPKWQQVAVPSWFNQGLGALALVFTIVIILWSAPYKPGPEIFQFVSQFYIKCIACVIMILLLINTRHTVFNFVMSNWLFRSVGVIGFSFYLLHGVGMQVFDHFAATYLGQPLIGDRAWSYTFGAFVVSYLLAIVAYSYIERPFFGFRGASNKGDVKA